MDTVHGRSHSNVFPAPASSLCCLASREGQGVLDLSAARMGGWETQEAAILGQVRALWSNPPVTQKHPKEQI